MTDRRADRRRPVDEGTALPPLTLGLAKGAVGGLVVGTVTATVFWLTVMDDVDRLEKYISRFNEAHAEAQEEREQIRAHIVRECIRSAVAEADPGYPCLGVD